MNTVLLTTLANVNFWSSRIALTFCSTRSVCILMSPATRLPVFGSIGIWPAQNNQVADADGMIVRTDGSG